MLVLLGNSESARFPCHIRLGKSATIDFSRKVDDNKYSEYIWDNLKVSYAVDGSTCNLILHKVVEKNGNVNHASIILQDGKHKNCYYIDLSFTRITDTDFLTASYLHLHSAAEFICECSSIPWMKTKRTIRGGIMDTQLYLYGSGNRWGLLVSEAKKNSWSDEKASEMTVAHYFANSNGIILNATETDIGLSMVAKFRVYNDKLDVVVEGPQQHPVSALFYMFDQVCRAGFWKLTMCPHCDNIQRGKMFWQSDNEESDSVPMLPRRGSSQNARSIANGGRFKGNGNGNFIKCRNLVLKERS